MTMLRARPILCALAAAALLAGCAGGAGGAVPGAPALARPDAAASRVHRAPVHFHFRIPRRHKGGAHFLSPNTASIVVTVYDATHVHQLAKTTQNTTPGENRFTLGVPPGTDTFDVDAFDAKNGGGSKLSAIAGYAYTVGAGKSNSISMTLGGIPASLSVTLVGTSIFAHGTQSAGFAFGGVGSNAAQQLQLTAEDADHEVIVGPGSPALTLTGGDSNHLTIAPVSGSTGLFALTPREQSSSPLAMTATATPSTGAPLVAGFTLSLDAILYEISCWNTTVSAFAPWSADPILTLTSSNGIEANSSMALDSAGNLYLANYLASPNGAVLEFEPGSATASRTIEPLNDPGFVAVDSSGDIFVTEAQTDVEEFTPSGGSTPSRTLTATNSPAGIDGPTGLAVDAAGNLYVANSAGSLGVSIYAPGTSTTPAATMNSGMGQPHWLAFDSAGHLYVANYSGQNVTEYGAPFSPATSVLQTFGSSATIDQPQYFAVDANGNVYVATTSTAVEFAPNASVMRTITPLGLAGTNLVTVDPMGNAYLPDENTETIGVYAPGSSTTATMTYGPDQISGPMDVVVWP